MGTGRGRTVPLDRITLGRTGNWAHVEDLKGGASGRRKVGVARVRNSFGPPGMGEKRRRAVAVGGPGSRPGGQSLRDRLRGGSRNRLQREREMVLTGEIWGGQWEIGPGGGRKYDPEHG